MAKSSRKTRAELIAEARQLRKQLNSKRRLVASARNIEASRELSERHAEQQRSLEKSQQEYADLYDFAPVGCLTLDAQGTIREINLCAAAMLGTERGRLIGMRFVVYVERPDREAFLRHMTECRQRAGRVTSELTLRSSGKPTIPVHFSSVCTGDGNDARFRTVMVDLSERKRVDAELGRYQERLRSLTAEVALTEERERRRIATALHDNLGQNLALARIKLGALGKKLPADQDLRDAQQFISEAVRQVRSLTHELSPPALYTLSFQAALDWLAERYATFGLKVKVTTDGRRLALSEELRVLFFQGVRELLTNVVKHARATLACVRISTLATAVEVAVEDDGIGFPAALNKTAALSQGAEGGFGLLNLRTRFEHVGGRLNLAGRPGGGACVSLIVPMHYAGFGVTRDRDRGKLYKKATDHESQNDQNPSRRRSPDRPPGPASPAGN